MQIFVVGMNHKSAPIALRERFAFPCGTLEKALDRLRKTPPLYESLLLATCNRTEIYGVSEIHPDYVDWVSQVLSEEKGIPAAEFRANLYVWSGPDAVEHLFKVVCGLDSMVVGETEILGQVKKAYEKASATKNTGKILHRLFQTSFHTAKAVHGGISDRGAEVSVSSVAVDLARRIFSDLAHCKAMIVGAGQMGEQTVEHLMKEGVRSIVASNRSFARAQEIARTFGGEAVDLDGAMERMIGVDIVISSTASPHILFTRDQIQLLMLRRKNRPLFFIDIAVPRDIDPRANELDDVFLYNIDDLRQISEEKRKQRERFIEHSGQCIRVQADKFLAWFAALGVVPTIDRLNASLETVRAAELEKSLSRLSELSAYQREEVDYLTKRIVAQILHRPKEQLKRFANRKDGYYYTETLSDLFGLTEDTPHPTLPPQGGKEKISG